MGDVARLEETDERFDDRRVELRARRLDEALDRFRVRHAPAVRAVGDHRVERVADEHDARLDRDLVAGLAVRVPARRPSARGRRGRSGGRREPLDRREDLLAELGVPFTISNSSSVSGPGFWRISDGIPILPMSWKSAPSSRRFSASRSSSSSRPTSSAMSLIQRAWDDVYSSFASSAFASVATVETNVRSSPSKCSALSIASFA